MADLKDEDLIAVGKAALKGLHDRGGWFDDVFSDFDDDLQREIWLEAGLAAGSALIRLAKAKAEGK